MDLYCINCGYPMEDMLIYDDGCHETTVEWCEQCGSIVKYYDNDVSVDEWKIPILAAGIKQKEDTT